MFNKALNTRSFWLPLLGTILALLALIAGQAFASPHQAPPPASPATLDLSLDVFASGFTAPVDLANAGDDRLFVVEKAGRIKILLSDGTVLPTPFLDITGRVDSSASEEGLLGLVFHPNYAANGFFFVNYTHTDSTTGIRRTRISRFSVTADPNVADPNSELILLTITQPFSNHNAGDLLFGPDGLLYIPLGDGGGGGDPQNNAQTLTTLLGKIARIDVDASSGTAPDCVGSGSGSYTVPPSNPLVDGPGGTCDEIWAIGLRNPWRASFDRLTGDLFIADVGQNTWEEVDFQPYTTTTAINYGWRCYEGNHTFNTTGCGPASNYTFPIFEYNHTSNGCSVTGGFVYRGTRYPAMAGHYLLTDYCSGIFWDLVSDGAGGWTATRHSYLGLSGLASFGEALDGELYLANVNNGTVYHLVENTLTSSIALSKTVGTDPLTCAPENQIEVAPGQVVSYCYEVTNTGTLTLTQHDLDDSQLGTLLSAFAFDLAPGATLNTVDAGLTISAAVTATTVNTATWTAYNPGPSDQTSAEATAAVTVIPPAIRLTKTVGLQPGVCPPSSTLVLQSSATVYYCYQVANTGLTPFSLHDLDDSQFGTLLSAFPYDLAPGTTMNTAGAGLAITATITATTVNTATWTAYNPGPADSASGTAQARVIVTPYILHLPTIIRLALP